MKRPHACGKSQSGCASDCGSTAHRETFDRIINGVRIGEPDPLKRPRQKRCYQIQGAKSLLAS